MISLLGKPISFFLIMVVGYLLKQKHFFHESDARLLMKIIMNITLPMAVIHAFSSFPRERSYLWIVVLGFLCASVPLLIVTLLVRSKTTKMRIFYMLNVAGFNIVCFALPIIQGLFGSFGAVIACLFDTGNAIMMTGGSYAFTSTLLKTGAEKESFKSVLMKFLNSIPFCAYMVMLMLVLMQIEIPSLILTISEPLANANAFLAMLMLGIMFKIEKSPIVIKEVVKLLCTRICFSILLAYLMFNFLPFSLEIRKVLAVVVFAPISTLAPVYSLKCHGDEATSSFANSLSIVIGLVLMCAVSIIIS